MNNFIMNLLPILFTSAWGLMVCVVLGRGTLLFVHTAGKAVRIIKLIINCLQLLIAVLIGIALVGRSLIIGFPALTGMYESLLFFSAAIAGFGAFAGFQRRLAIPTGVHAGVAFIALLLLTISSSPLAPAALIPPVPALRSGWLVVHVAFSFIGEALFAVSFVTALAFLINRNKLSQRLTDLSIGIGYPIYTAGALIFGAIWAQTAWGVWWSWDPKEIWALVTWLVYTLYLHLRLFRKKNDRLSAWIAVIGFACTLFTFFGVNFLMSGLHSYR